MWHLCELVAILVLLEIAESSINLSPHPVRRAILGFLSWTGGFAVCILLLADSSVAAVTVQLLVLVLAAYMIHWFIESLVYAIRAPQLFELPRRRDLAVMANGVTNVPMRQCSEAVSYVLREHDRSVALLGLINLAEKNAGRNLTIEWLDACDGARLSILELLGRAGAGGSTNAFFLARLLCMYEEKSVEQAIDACGPRALDGAASRRKLASRLEQVGRARPRAEEYGLPVPQRAKARAPSDAEAPLHIALLPGLRLASLGFTRRGTAFCISHTLMILYGIIALVMHRSSGYVFLGVGILIYILAMAAMGDFRDLARHMKEEHSSKAESA